MKTRKIFLYTTVLVLLTGLVYLLVVSGSFIKDKQYATANASMFELEPHPSLKPEEVVSIQMEALKNNNHPYTDHGIEVAYNFASPANRESTGPLERFTSMVRNDTYQSLLNFQRHGLDEIEVDGEVAVQKVTIIDAQDNPVVYFFQLSRQSSGPYKDCWMTDSVIRY